MQNYHYKSGEKYTLVDNASTIQVVLLSRPLSLSLSLSLFLSLSLSLLIYHLGAREGTMMEEGADTERRGDSPNLIP